MKRNIKRIMFIFVFAILIFTFTKTNVIKAFIGECKGVQLCFQYDGGSGGSSTYGIKISIFSVSESSGSSSSFLNTSGHSFISIENMSTSYTFTTGNMELSSSKTLTLGTWGNKGHDGIWYNLESHYINSLDAYSGRVSLTETNNFSTSSDLDAYITKINNYIKSNDKWSMLNNCSSFAKGLWNTISTISLSAGTPNTPTALKSSIMSNHYNTNYLVSNNAKVGYYNNGQFVSF